MIERKKMNFFRRGLKYLRRSVFLITSEALENNVVNPAIYLVAIVLELCQIAPFYFSIGLRVADNNPVGYPRFYPMINVFYTATGSQTVLNASFSSIMIFAFTFVSVIVILICLMIYCESISDSPENQSSRYKFATCVYKFISFVLVLISSLASWTFFLLFVMPFNCQYLPSGAVYSNDSSVTCWNGLHLAVVFVDCLNIILFLLVLSIFETLFTDTSPRSQVPWACTQANQNKLVKHLSKLILACFTIFDPNALYYNYLFVLQILTQCIIVYIVVMSPSYINRICGRAIIFAESFILFLIIAMYIFRLINIVVLPIGVIMLIVLLFSMAGLMVFAKCKYDEYILGLQITTTKSEAIKDYYFYELFRLIDLYATGDSGVIINLYGIYINHQLLCTNPSCSCGTGLINKNLEALKKREEGEGGEKGGHTPGEGFPERAISASRSNMSSMFQIAMSKSFADASASEEKKDDAKEDEKDSLPDNFGLLIQMSASLIDYEVASNIASVPLRMISAYFYKEYIGNIFKSMYELIFIQEKQKPSLRDRFLIYKYKRVIEEEMSVIAKKGSVENGVDVEKLIEFEKHYETFRAQAESTSNIVNRFWEQLKNKDLDVNGLYEIGSKVGNLYAEMQSNYAVAIGIFPQNYKLVSEFGKFEKCIMNNDMVAKNYEVRAKQIFREQADQNHEGVKGGEGNITDSNSVYHRCVCVVSGNPHTMGDIASINNEITHILGFKAKEIVGQNCGILCPQYISSKHNQMIENFIQRGTSKVLRSRRTVIACNSQGFLVFLDSLVKILPSVDQGIKFVGILKKIEDFGEFFKEKGSICSSSDFAFIVTSLEGQIYGINENCMNRLGIPVSLFKSKGSGEDAIMINTLIKELEENDVEESLLNEGKKLSIDTGILKFSINKENLSKKEIYALDTRAGRYKVFVKLSKENYGQGLAEAKVYKMLIYNQESTTNPPGIPEGQKSSLKISGESARLLGVDSKVFGKQRGRQKEGGGDENKTEEGDDDSRASMANMKSLNDFKQMMNVKSAAINVTVINRSVNLVFFVMVVIAIIEFALALVDQANSVQNLQIVFVTNRRITDLGLIASEVFLMLNMVNTSTSYTSINGVNLYEYVREYGYRSIGTLGNEESYMNTLSFSYTPALTTIENQASLPVVTLGGNMQQQITYFSINTAITQFDAKAADYFSYAFNDLQGLVNNSASSAAILAEYFFIKENGLRNLTTNLQTSEQDFRTTIEGRVGGYYPYFLGAAILVAASLIISYSILIPKLLGLQREKINVLMLYTQMKRKEVDTEMAKCLEYQKANGFWDINEENDQSDSVADIQDNDEKKELTSRKFLETKKEDNMEIHPAIVLEEKNEESEEDESEEDSDSDSNEESKKVEQVKNEDEITIQEQLNPEQLKAKLSTNKCSLILLICIVCSLYLTYFVTQAIKPVYDANDAKDSLEYTHGISRMLSAPLYLLLYSLVSVKENRTFYIANNDSVSYYLNEFLTANSFKQTVTAAQNSFISSTQDLFSTLDSTSFCSELMSLFNLIQTKYPNFAYRVQNQVTQSACTTYQNGLLNRGLTQGAFMIYQEVKQMQALREEGSSNINITSSVQQLAMLLMFLAPVYEGLQLDLMDNVQANLSTLKSFLILFFVFYILASFVVHLLFWTCFLQAMETELVKSRGMLKIMPLELIDKLKKMKKEKANINIVTFFKAFEKN